MQTLREIASWLPGHGWVDPVKEAQACQIRMDIGLSTLEAECAGQGLDWEEVLEQRAREKAKLAELGLTTGDNNETHAKNSVGDNARDALDNDFDSTPNEQEP